MGWTRLSISRIEDLRDAVHGAGLEAFQLCRAPPKGSLAFATSEGVTYSTGSIDGQICLRGPLSEKFVTVGLGIELPAGARQWLNDTTTGAIGVFLQGDPHDAFYVPGSTFATAALTADHLEEIAANIGFVLGPKELGETGIIKRRLTGPPLKELQIDFKQIHSIGDSSSVLTPDAVGRRLLSAIIQQLGRLPCPRIGKPSPSGYISIVSRARDFIHENLGTPLSIEAIAAATPTSQRTLYRAFVNVLDETPYSYVQKLRFHRIRNELISSTERDCTIRIAARRWRHKRIRSIRQRL